MHAQFGERERESGSGNENDSGDENRENSIQFNKHKNYLIRKTHKLGIQFIQQKPR